MLKNPRIINRAEEALVRAGAAVRCISHGSVSSVENIPAVQRAVTIARLNPFEQLSANAAELAVLETYMTLADACPRCRRTNRKMAAKRLTN